ncbi:hypothetical protein GGR53DRAFT_344542 [Hypoxylon sp. FL1150]|nr:hypothetical protein GGR53DRAFT_344542 [Hypoxylon sp. FL1150]
MNDHLSQHKMHIPVNQDGTLYTECQVDHNDKDLEKRILFKPQVTVNVYNTGGSNRGETSTEATSGGIIPSETSAGGPGTTRSETPSTGSHGSALGDGTDPIIKLLVAQVAVLSEKVEQLSVEVATQRHTGDSSYQPIQIDAGSWSTSDVRSWQNPCSQTSGRVTFSKQFQTVPNVTVSMKSADVNRYTNFRVRVYATDVDLEGFTVHADSWHDTKIYMCGVSWMAIGR